MLQTKQKGLQTILVKNLAIKNLLHRNYVLTNSRNIDTTEKFEFPFLLLPMNTSSVSKNYCFGF